MIGVIKERSRPGEKGIETIIRVLLVYREAEGSAPAPMRRGLKPADFRLQFEEAKGSAPAPMRRGLKRSTAPFGKYTTCAVGALPPR